jgi:hypothetical protein
VHTEDKSAKAILTVSALHNFVPVSAAQPRAGQRYTTSCRSAHAQSLPLTIGAVQKKNSKMETLIKN